MMNVFLLTCFVAILVAGPIGLALGLRQAVHWGILLVIAAVLGLFVVWFDAGEIALAAFWGSMITLGISRIVYHRRGDKPTVLFVLCTALICTFTIGVVLGPRTRGAKEVGRRHRMQMELQKTQPITGSQHDSE